MCLCKFRWAWILVAVKRQPYHSYESEEISVSKLIKVAFILLSIVSASMSNDLLFIVYKLFANLLVVL